MKKILFMAIDLGTSFIKGAVYDLEGACLDIVSEPVKDERQAGGIFIQRGEDLLGSVTGCMKHLSEKIGDRANDIEAIAFTGQMAGFMGVDKDWNDITTWSCSLDTRYIPYADRQMKELKKEFLEISGTNAPQMAPKFEWFKNEFPEENSKISKYQMISGYIIGQLGDIPAEDAVIDKTFTTWTGLADIAKGEWSKDICDAVGMDIKYLPRIVESDSICARLSDKAGKEVGLKGGIPLVSGAGDKSASCVGSGILAPGDANFEASSYGAIHVCVEDYRADSEEMMYDCLPSPIAGLYHVTRYIPGSGITLDWYIENFAKEQGQTLAEAFFVMEEKIKDVPAGCDGLSALGLLGGNAMPLNGKIKGEWKGFSWNHKPEHFYRALIESFTYDFELTFRRIEAKYPELKPKALALLGGGSNSAAWAQINADVTGKTFFRINRKDTALLGTAILAGSAIGAIDDIRAHVQGLIRKEEEYYPVQNMRAVYKPHVENYWKTLKEYY